MAHKNNKILSNDMVSIRNRINGIRQKYGLGQYSFSALTIGETITSSQIKDVKNKMEQTTKDAAYVIDKTYNFGDIESGNLIKGDSLDKIEAELTTLEGLCNNCPHNGSHYSTNRSLHDYSDYSNKSVKTSDYKTHKESNFLDDSSEYTSYYGNNCSQCSNKGSNTGSSGCSSGKGFNDTSDYMPNR